MKITVVGTGYVGLVSGACLAEVGNDVLCFDVDREKVDFLNKGGIPIHEPDLEAMVHRNCAAGRFRFTADVDEAVAFGLLQFIAVGTVIIISVLVDQTQRRFMGGRQVE